MISVEKVKVLQRPYLLLALFALITIGITAQSFLKKLKTFDESGLQYTHYNNYVIFKNSFYHLQQNKDLYQLYPEEHWDLYKYSPSFAVLMAPMAVLPDGLGLLCWNLLNVLLLFYALWKLPTQTNRTRLMMLALVLIELITSTQNSQSNGLIAGLLICAFTLLEKNKGMWASLLIVLSVFIKLFGGLAFALFLFYPNKVKHFAYTALWTIILTLLPLIFVSTEQLIFLYKSWWNLLQSDHGISTGLSVAGWLSTWFGIEAKSEVVLIGIVLFCLPLLNIRAYQELLFKKLFLASILIWVIIFNHRAESATFVIAVSGIGIWAFSQQLSKINLSLLLLAIIFTILSPTDLFPRAIRNNYVVPYVLKAVPCILIWMKILFEMIVYKTSVRESK